MRNFFASWTLLALLTMSCAPEAFPAAAIFSSSDVKILKQNLDFNGGPKILTGTVTVTSSATSAPVGSLYLNSSTAKVYKKNDSGSSTNWSELTTSASTNYEPRTNYLYNSNFPIWQRLTTTTVANSANAYAADQWYVVNGLGTNGVITYSQVAGASDGSKFGASVKITTAPTAAQATVIELRQTLPNISSLQLYNKSVSFSVLVKALGNVNQVGVQFMYKTTAAKVDTTLGAEGTCVPSTGAWVLCSTENISVSTTPTLAGVVGVRIRTTGVSSGNIYDLNNGFIVEQAMLNQGATAAAYQPMGRTFSDEVSYAQMFYEKSYNLTTNPGTVTAVGAYQGLANTAGQVRAFVSMKTRKIATPTITVYSSGTGTSAKCYDTGTAGDFTASTSNPGEATFQYSCDISAAIRISEWQWVSDASF